jgi:hypothetical protein
MTDLVIGVSATKSSWSQDLRKYVRDHTQGIAVEVIMDPGRLLKPGDRRRFDVVLIDDVMRLFGAQELAAAQDNGAVIIGLFDERSGMGREFLARLGANRLVPSSTPPAQLVEMIQEVGPLRTTVARPKRLSGTLSRPNPRRGWISAWTKVSGGVGLTETVIATAETLSAHKRVLLIEAEEIGPIMAARLRRSAESGLAPALNRIGRGQTAFPEALSAGVDDGSVALGGFDVICQTSMPGGPAITNPVQLVSLLDEAATIYDHVMVETGVLVNAASGVGRDRLAATRAALGHADGIVVLAAADPNGAVKLLEWQATSLAARIVAPTWAAFGRASRSGFEQAELAHQLELAGPASFGAIVFLPEDKIVSRARWNGGLVWKGRWLRAVQRLAQDLDLQSGTQARSFDLRAQLIGNRVELSAR